MLTPSQLAVLGALFGLVLFLIVYARSVLLTAARKDQRSKEKQEEEEREGSAKARKDSASGSGAGKKAGRGKASKVVQPKDTFTHGWLLTTLKGHSGRVLDLDFSENGKYLASCSDDRSVLIWTCKDFSQKEHKLIRGNVNYDHATKIKWSPDSKAYIVNKATENAPEVYKINKRDDGSLGNIQPIVTFPKRHETDVIGLGFACTGRFVMTCSDKTTLVIWSIRGEELATIDTYHMSTYCAKISPCGRFVASSGFTPDVKVWEVKFAKNGEFQKVHRAFELPGHGSGVFSFDFNADSARMVTLSKDGKWRLFNTNVEFERGQDPSILSSGSFPNAGQSSLIALSPDSKVVAIADGRNVSFFCAESGQAKGSITDLHKEDITSICFDKESRWVVTSGDRHIRVFHNVPGFKLKLVELRSKLPKASTAGMRERLEQQIAETEETLKRLNEL